MLSRTLTLTALFFFSSLCTAQRGRVSIQTLPSSSRKICTVYSHANTTISDVPNILAAFSQCGHGGRIIFPEKENYWIAEKLNPSVEDVEIEWRGMWTFSDDMEFWRKEGRTYGIAFQNHAASLVVSGRGVWIDGDVWYTAEAGTTLPGRPMPFVFWNVSDVTVRNFKVLQPPLWSLNVMNGTNLVFENLYCNATATKAPYGENWVQNTDGFDTMDVNNVRLTNFTYQGGDDCVAIKPRSYNIIVQNATCRGGNGMAIGSLGQYLEDSSVENVLIDNVKIIRYNEDMHNSAYIKTWVGHLVPQPTSYESDYLPRGGGWGHVKNIQFSNFQIQGAAAGPAITQDNGNNGSFSGTSLMDISNVAFVNFTGYLENVNTTASVSCSTVHPCFNVEFEGMDVRIAENSTGTGTAKCVYVEEGGVHGVEGSGC